MPHILFIASECAPYVKSGGLGDVIGSLPQAIAAEGYEISVMLPLYGEIDSQFRDRMEFLGSIFVPLSWRKQYAGLFRLKEKLVTYYFVDNRYYFDRGGLYGSFDDGERFAFFSKASLELLPHLDSFPDILHCNDWQTGMIPVYYKTQYAGRELYRHIRTVFTIHNIEYQGKYNHAMLGDILGLSGFHLGLLDLDGLLNYMKGAIVSCDALTTVSPTYAEEIRYPFFGQGMEGILRENAYKLKGILNGIDETLYNPATDPDIPYHYDKASAQTKAKNKEALACELNLSYNHKIPLIGMVTRLVHHKGIDLVKGVFDELMQQNLQLVILGTGDAAYETWFRERAWHYQGQFSLITAFSSSLASRIYAGADFFLMPSISEPCGLSQMIALKYGTIPIVRKTGGLGDSIRPFSPKGIKGNGFTFETINAHDMLDAVQRGLSFYDDAKLWKRLIRNAFESDFSWKHSAGEYISIYNNIYGTTTHRKG